MAKKKLVKEPKEDMHGLTEEQFKAWELEESSLEDFKKRNNIK